MSFSSRLRQSDCRTLYLALGECCELGRSPEAWVRRLHERFTELVGVDRSLVVDRRDDAAIGRRLPGPKDRVMALGWSGGNVAATMRAYYADKICYEDPSMETIRRLTGRTCALSRPQMARDHDWYRSIAYNDYYRGLDVDQYLVSRRPRDDGSVLYISLWREVGRSPFDEREIELVSLAHAEVENLMREGRLSPLRNEGEPGLTRRQREVLHLLGTGLTEKEVADDLDISIHTVHDHVKALHRTLGVGTRGELVGIAHAWEHGELACP